MSESYESLSILYSSEAVARTNTIATETLDLVTTRCFVVVFAAAAEAQSVVYFFILQKSQSFSTLMKPLNLSKVQTTQPFVAPTDSVPG